MTSIRGENRDEVESIYRFAAFEAKWRLGVMNGRAARCLPPDIRDALLVAAIHSRRRASSRN